MSKMSDRDRAKRQKSDARAMVDNAPVSGGKAYLKLPDNVKLFQPKADTKYRLLFLSWVAGEGNVAYKKGKMAANKFFFIHRNLGPNNESHLCPQMMYRKPCAVCSKFSDLKAGARGKSKDFYNENVSPVKFKERELFLIHDLEGPKNNLMVWDESVYLFGNFLREKLELEEKWDFADDEDGCVVVLRGKEKAIGNSSCTEYSAISFATRKEAIPSSLIKLVEGICVDDFVVETSNSQLAKLVGWTGLPPKDDDEEEDDEDKDDDEEDDDEEEAPRRPSKHDALKARAEKQRSKAKAKDEDEEEEEEEEEDDEPDDDEPDEPDEDEPEDEDEEENGKPARKGKKAKKEESEDDEPEEEPEEEPDDEDDEEDEEDEKPAKKGKASGKRLTKAEREALTVQNNREMDELEAADDPDEEPAPKKRKRR